MPNPTYRHRNRWRTTVRTAVLTRDGACRLCGHPGTDGHGRTLTLAHLIPHNRGGADTPDNLVLLCRPCHARFDLERRGGRRSR